MRLGQNAPYLFLALKSEDQTFFYWKGLAFEEEAVVYTMTSEFLTLITNFLEEEFVVVPIVGKAAVLRYCIYEIECNSSLFCDPELWKQSRVSLCPHGVLNKSTSTPSC